MQIESQSNTSNLAPRFEHSQIVARTEIVSLIDGQVVTTTLAIASGCKVDHASVIKLVRTYQTDLEEFGLVGFEIQPRPLGQHGGSDTEYALLNEQQSTLIMTYMRNSPVVREFKKTLVKEFWSLIRGKPVALPSYAETLRLYADQIEQTQRVTHERDHAVATKAEIGNRREATAMATASAAVREASRLKAELGRNAQAATIIAVEKACSLSFGKQGFRPLQKWCKSKGITPIKVPCPRYGEAAAWPAQAWFDCYNIDLGEVFGGEA